MEADNQHALETMLGEKMKIAVASLILMSSLFAQNKPATTAANPTAEDVQHRIARFAPVELRADTSTLSDADRQAMQKLIQAAHIIDVLQLRQRWSQNERLWAALKADKTPLG